MRTKRVLIGAALAALGLFLVAGPASAHVTIPGTAPKGGYGIVTISVPNESDSASTVKLEVQLPKDVTIRSVRPQVKPGWTATVTKRTLDEPITGGEGGDVTEVVDTVTWEGGSIGPGQFDTFSLSMGPLPDDVDELTIPAIQTYSDGEEVAWIEATPASGEEPEHPAPVLHLAAASADDHHDDDADEAVAPADDGGDDSDSGDGLAIAAIVVSVLALGVGGIAVRAARKTG
jgi:uncharacterized protein YcnI